MKKNPILIVHLFFISTMLLYSCNEVISEDNLENILIIKQCDGVYEYSGKELSKKLLFNIDTVDVYLENPFVYVDKQLEIGFRYREEEKDSISLYSKYYSTEKEIKRIVKHTEIDYSTIVRESTTSHNREIVIDTFTNCRRLSSSSVRYKKYDCINKEEDFERFYTEDVLENGNKTYSRRGDIYLETSKGIQKLTNFTRRFDSKFGTGFYNPNFIKNGRSIIFTKLLGILSTSTPILYEYDIEKQIITKIITGKFSNMTVSKDTKYMLFSRAKKSDYKVDLDCRNHTVYIMNLSTKKYQVLGRGRYFEWKDETEFTK